MNLFTLSLAYIRRRKLHTLLNVMLLALGTATIAVLLLVGKQVEDKFTRDIQGIDMVIGAKGSPLQIILSAVFHIDSPTGNIPLEEARTVAAHRAVAQAIPLALGDNYEGYRIVGTTPDYAVHYGAELAQGTFWEKPLELTIGAQVAREAGLSIGDRVISIHGLSGGGTHAHDDQPMRVVGILQPTGSVIDRLLLTGVETVWLVHEPHDDHSHDDHDDHCHEHHSHEHHSHEHHSHDDHGHDHHHDHGHAHEGVDAGARDIFGLPVDAGRDAERALTAMLIRYRSPMAAATFPRYINEQTSLQAASPAVETTRLFSLLGVGFDAVRTFGFVLIFAAMLSVFITLYNTLKERRYDLAMMRTLGASRGMLMLHILVEGVLLTLMGALAGLVLGHAVVGMLGLWARDVMLTGWTYVSAEFWLLGMAVVLGILAALIPAIQVYRADVAKTLSES